MRVGVPRMLAMVPMCFSDPAAIVTPYTAA